mmetsp:Transcript_52540/g.122968  ORF Transcript_52540/g.122968 Transcript_52540/m.122968 type:complete len:276 (+) Transcript_52540:957-1784(+)
MTTCSTTIATVTCQEKESDLDPRLPNHQTNKGPIEDKPSIGEGVALVLESKEANSKLDGKCEAEEVLNDLKDGIRFTEDCRLVVVSVNGQPECVQCDDCQGGILERVVACPLLPNAMCRVEILHVVLTCFQHCFHLPLALLSRWSKQTVRWPLSLLFVHSNRCPFFHRRLCPEAHPGPIARFLGRLCWQQWFGQVHIRRNAWRDTLRLLLLLWEGHKSRGDRRLTAACLRHRILRRSVNKQLPALEPAVDLHIKSQRLLYNRHLLLQQFLQTHLL